MKSTITAPAPPARTTPQLRTCPGFPGVVLLVTAASSPDYVKGIIVATAPGFHPVGYDHGTWTDALWEPFTGSVTLQN